MCSRVRGIGHVPTAVKESNQWKTKFNKYEIARLAVLEIKRLESVVKIYEGRIENIIRNVHKPSIPALVGRPRTEPPSSAEEERNNPHFTGNE